MEQVMPANTHHSHSKILLSITEPHDPTKPDILVYTGATLADAQNLSPRPVVISFFNQIDHSSGRIEQFDIIDNYCKISPVSA